MLCQVGTLNENSIKWYATHQYDTGRYPRVAMNDSGVVVEVHQSSSETKLWYNVGCVDEEIVIWNKSLNYDTGEHPCVAINNKGDVVEVHKSEHNSGLWYHVGKIKDNIIEWGDSIEYGKGHSPSVALTDDGLVIEVHESTDMTTLWRRAGQLNGMTITWSGADTFDSGVTPSVGCGGKYAIQTHVSNEETTMWCSTSLIRERAGWMHDNFQSLKSKTLKELTLPASHDSGMYISALGKTQHKDIYDQLCYGIRYFDLRPAWHDDDLWIFHGAAQGPRFSEVLENIQRFMQEDHRELVILKLSHYESFNDAVYAEMLKRIHDSLDPWLLRTRPEGQRLAELPLGDLISDRGVALVVCSGDYPTTNISEGIWVYRDWDTKDPDAGHLTVFDQYSDTTNYNTMKSEQLNYFHNYDGKCTQKSNVLCDLFLLSWTLTPITGVWDTCKEANRNLGPVLADLTTPNQLGFIPIILYVDYVENARATDIAILQNGLT
jgi:hypothetical protein